MIKSLKDFVMTGGTKIAELSKDASKIRSLKKETRNVKQGVKIADWLFGSKDKSMSQYGKGEQIPVPKDAYLSYQGVPLNNIRPYTDMEIAQAETNYDWANAYL
jgi:hypothetical protein